VEVRGPTGSPEAEIERLGSTFLFADAVAGETTAVHPVLARGCVLTVSGRRGGSPSEPECGDGGAVALEIPPRAFARASGEAVDGTIALALAHVSRDRPSSLLALPDLDEDVGTVAAAEVHAFEVETGERLRIADGLSVRLRFEVPADTPGDATFESIEDGADAWTAEAGTLVTEGGVRFAQIDATHFSAYRLVVLLAGYHCLRFELVCPPGETCSYLTDATVQIVTSSGRRISGTADQCFELGGNLGSDVGYFAAVRWGSPLLTGLFGDPIFLGYSRGTVTLGSGTPMCGGPPSACERDPVELFVQPSTCVSGPFEVECGPGCTEPTFGAVTVYADGDRVATQYVLAMCGGRMCVSVPAFASEIAIEDSLGHRAIVDGPFATGGVCGPPMAPIPECDDGATGCASIAGAGRCTDSDCLSALFDATVSRSSACPGGTSLVSLDASASRGPVRIYDWYAYHLEPGGGRVLFDFQHRFRDPLLTLCVPDGDIEIVLLVSSDVRSIQWSQYSRTLSVDSMCRYMGGLDIDGTWDVTRSCDRTSGIPGCAIADPSGTHTVTITADGAAVEVVDEAGRILAGSRCGEIFRWGGSLGGDATVSHIWYHGAGDLVAQSTYALGSTCVWTCGGTADRR
jgi:hypothetical protein